MQRSKRAKTGSSAPALVVAASGLVLAAFPVFLVGGLAVQIRAELGFSETALGAAVTGAFLMSAVAGPAGGRLSDRLGPRRAVLTGCVLSVAALVGVGVWARSWWVLAALLTVSGLALVFTDPGLAILIARTVPGRRQGLAFGVKEASIPAATLVAGLAVPAIALTLGWRYAFALGVVPLATLLVVLPRLDLGSRPLPSASPTPEKPAAVGPPPPGAVRMVAAGAALASSAASGISVFLTESGVAMGLSPASAGWLLAGGSVAGIAGRIIAGLVSDRTDGPQLGLIAAMMAAGAVSMAVGAGGVGPLLVIGTVGVFAGGWGWSGLLFLSLVRASPSSPGAVAGIGLMGLATGNALGPLSFGILAQRFSFATAWIVMAVLAGCGAVVMLSARRRFVAT